MRSELGPFATRWAPSAMVCSVDHLASGAGVEMLRHGGSAADAAVAASAVLAVTSPHMCGMGGDLLALVHQVDGAPVALRSCGRAGSGADPARLRAEGATRMPFRGDVRSVPVPGCVDGWLALHDRFGRLPLADVLQPAIALAANGFPASALLAAALLLLEGVPGTEDFRAIRHDRAGDRCRRAGTAAALRAVAERGRDGFYLGSFGEGLLALGQGEYAAEDLAVDGAEWVEAIGRRVWDHDLWTTPPGSQGYLTVASALVAEGLALPDDPDDELWAHLLVESARQAGHDRPAVLHDGADPDALLDLGDLHARQARIRDDRCAALTGSMRDGGTIYLCAVDGDGMGVSLIQSNASDFGAHIVEPSTGTFLHNRGIGFSLEPGHPAEYGPRRRPPTTLSPALVTRPDGSLRAVLGTMGGDSQPQIVLQLACRLLHHGATAGSAVSSPRFVLANHGQSVGFDTWSDLSSLGVDVESSAPDRWFDGLARRGHDLRRVGSGPGVGHAHLIDVGPWALGGLADPRAGASAAAGF